MKNLYRIFIVLLLLFPFAKAIGGNIYGQITNSNTFGPISNKVVYLYGDTINNYYDTVLTDTSGNYHFQNVPAMPQSSHYYVKVYDCNNTPITHQIDSLDAYSAFSICANIPCFASFASTSDTLNLHQISFTNTSIGNPSSFFWNFGDNTTSIVQNPTHTYASYGQYVVTLTISGANCNSSIYDTITVGPPCIANFGYYVNSGNPLEISFYDSSSSNITSYFWTFGDGNSSVQKNPIHTYSQAGNYTVNLYAYNSYCSASKTISITVINPCQANFISLPDTINPYLYYFIDYSVGNPSSYWWNFGDGTTSALQNPTHIYNSPGTYIISLSISGSFCNSSFVDTIIISGPCQALYSYAIDSINPMKVIFTDQSTANPNQWLWNFGDGTSSTNQNPSHIFSSFGSHITQLTISGIGCASSITDTIFLNTPNSSLIVFAFADTTRLNQGKAVLYSYDASVPTVTPYDTAVSALISGYPAFNFSNVSQGNYKIKILLPNPNPNFSTFYDTWYGNTFGWQYADSIYIGSGSTYIKTINLVINNVIMPQGNGVISGNIHSNATPSPNIDVYLLKNDSSIIQHTITDNQGNYNFNQLPYGNYIVYPELSGLLTIPAYIQLSSSQPNKEGLNFDIKSGTISVGVEEADIQKNIFTITPNPFNNFILLHSCISIKSSGFINIYNLQGEEVFYKEFSPLKDQNMEINLENLPSGLFIIRISTDSYFYSTKLLKY